MNPMKQSLKGLPYILRVYSILAFLTLTVFGSMHVAGGGKLTVGYLEITGGVIILLNMLALGVTRNVTVAKNIFLLVVLSFLALMLISGGTEGTGIFWLFVFPVIAFFLTGKRQGAMWMTGFFIVMVGIWLLSLGGTIDIPYDTIVLRQALLSILVVTIGMGAYEQSREWLAGQTLASRKALKTEKMQAEVILQHIDEGVVATDSEGNVTFMNQAAEKLLGWQLSDLLNKKFIDVVTMLDVAGNPIASDSRPLQRAVKADTALTTIATYLRKDGSTMPVSATGMPLVVDGKVVGGVGTFRDISEERSMVQAKSEFVTLASHQLRTPISAIAWVSELLLNGDVGKLSSEQRAQVDSIYKSNRRMAELVSEMLTVSSLDLNALPVIPQKIDIASVCAGVIKEQKAAYKDKEMMIIERYDPTLPRVSCDNEVTKLILRHLLSNAVKYTPKGGEITVRIEKKHGEKILPSSQGSIVITVIDNGYGIPEDATDKVFTKFFRAKNILHKDTDGTGLGLYIIKAVLDYVGGRVTFSSREGKGTTFRVLLPLEGMIKHKSQKKTGGADV